MNKDEVIKRAMYYDLDRVEKFIRLQRIYLSALRSMKESKNPAKELRIYNGGGDDPTCELSWVISRSCLSCPIFVHSGKRCIQNNYHKKICEISVGIIPVSTQRIYFDSIILFYVHVLHSLLIIRNELTCNIDK